MTENYQNIETKKITARVEVELADRVINKFHHGQQQALFRQIFKSLDALFQENKYSDIANYIYGSKSLTLKPIKDKDHASNGSNKNS